MDVASASWDNNDNNSQMSSRSVDPPAHRRPPPEMAQPPPPEMAQEQQQQQPSPLYADKTPLERNAEEHGVSLSMADLASPPGGDPDENKRYHNNNRKFPKASYIIMAVLVIVLLVAVPAGLGVGLSKKSSSNSGSSSINPSDDDTDEPYVPRTPEGNIFSPEFENLVQWLTLENISNNKDLLTPGTPQHRAAMWLSSGQGLNNNKRDDSPYEYMLRYILAVLYYSLNGEQWTHQADFLDPDMDVCEWNMPVGDREVRGVHCTSNHDLVLDLESNGLSGSLPTELGLVTTLSQLDMASNNLEGSIPNQLCNLSKLLLLQLQHNQLRHAFPACFDQLKNLHRVDLSYNMLSGVLPDTADFCNLNRMERFDATSNMLRGPIPECITSWGNLTELSLSGNSLTGRLPEGMSQMVSLRRLYLSDNDLKGHIPADMSQMTRLQRLYLDGNNFMGDPSFTIGELVNLDRLFLENNQFEGEIDAGFLHKLRYLFAVDISSNNFWSENQGIPDHFFAKSKLKILDFSNNQLAGSLPTNIPADFLKIVFFSVHGNQMTGPIPSQLSHLTQAWHLDLSNNNFDGTIPKELFQMTELFHLFVSENPGLTPGPIPSELANMVQLKELSMKNTNRNGPLPELVGFDDLKLLDLDNNKFSGTIPANYGQLPAMRHLLLNRNLDLRGEVPYFSSAAVNLTTVLLDQTGVTGDFSSICNLPVFRGIAEAPEGARPIVVTDCTNDCDCCHCCPANAQACSDPVVASLDWTWQNQFVRMARDFGVADNDDDDSELIPPLSAASTSP